MADGRCSSDGLDDQADTAELTMDWSNGPGRADGRLQARRQREQEHHRHGPSDVESGVGRFKDRHCNDANGAGRGGEITIDSKGIYSVEGKTLTYSRPACNTPAAPDTQADFDGELARTDSR